ncbi:putative toxin-antitoxin system toxin component, PIN family [Bacillus subtilis]|uniref:putative toxin-antitoxin system toxin component, PIN family n=1 Tax=Bacillus subtilis TaxID=1423 RepID=UPI002AA98404|nr:putative toxin-antitoxin system toxin component, PIN family [Bacillus subtilis]MDY7216837.1 putative toxin-antitoxin system toxin component, PIN family [Bacillus subtilis]
MGDRIVADTCVFIESIFGAEGNDSEIFFASLEHNDARLVFSKEIIGELMYILKKKCNDFSLSEEETKEVLDNTTALFQLGKSVNTKFIRVRVPRVKDPEDQMLVRAAYAADASHLVTLDKKSGILDLKNVPFICCTPKEYIKDNNEQIIS